MKNLVHKYSFLACTTLLSIPAAEGAVILWSTSLYPVTGFQGGALTTGVFNTSGALVYAENSGGAATVFDGINFSADASLVPGDNNSTFHAGLNTPLAQDGRYANGLQVITLGTGVIPALVVGQSYRIQLLIADGRGGAAGRTVALDGTNLGQYAYAVGAPDYS